MFPSPKKTKFGRKATKNDKFSCRSTEEMAEEMDLRTITIGTIHISLKCSTISLTLLEFFKSKKMKESLVEVKKEQSPVGSHGVITIDSFEENMAQKVILEKSNEEMTRHIRHLHVRAHFNSKPISKVLVDNGSSVNVMPLRILRALGRSIDDLLDIDVSMSAFNGEISKTLGILPIDITVGSKTSLSTFFTNYNAFLGRDWIHANWCVPSSLH